MTTTAPARSPTSQQPATATVFSPKPMRPNGGILLRSPSSECTSTRRNRCVKWKQKECEVFQVDDWDRSPCSVTPKLTYRDLVELKQLELDKVPHSPFRHLADLPMPIGLPRVGIQLQPMFDSSSSSEETGSSSSSSSSSTSSTTNGSSGPSTTSSLNGNASTGSNAIKTDQTASTSVGPSPAKAAPTPRSSPAPTPPRSESPQRSHQDPPSSSMPATPPDLPASPPSSDNGGFSKYCPQRRTHTPSCSASHLAKRRSPVSPSSSRMASVPPPPVFSPTLNHASFSTLQQTTPVAESATKQQATTASSSSASSSSPPSSSSTKTEVTRSSPLNKVEEEEPADLVEKPSSPSHPALVLTNALLEQELQDSERSRKAVFGTSPTSALSSSEEEKKAVKKEPCKMTAAIKRKFNFMPLLPCSDNEGSVNTTTSSKPSNTSSETGSGRLAGPSVVPVLDHPFSGHEMALHALADHPSSSSHSPNHSLNVPSPLGCQRSPRSPLQFEVMAESSKSEESKKSTSDASPPRPTTEARRSRPPMIAHEEGSDDGTMHSGCEQSENDLTDVDDHHPDHEPTPPAPTCASAGARKPSNLELGLSADRKRGVPASPASFGPTPPSSAIGALKLDSSEEDADESESGERPRRPSIGVLSNTDAVEASADMERSNSLGIELGDSTVSSSEDFGKVSHQDQDEQVLAHEKVLKPAGGVSVRVLMDTFSPTVAPLSSA